MSNFNWCLGPGCHTRETQSRIRGSGRNKVLRTMKIPLHSEYRRTSIWAYFCNQNCLFDYLNKHIEAIANIAPRREALETPIKVEKWKEESYRYQYIGNGQSNRVPCMSTRTEIKLIDNDNG